MKPHPYAAVLPLLEGKALADLTADVKTNGLREPIVLFAGMILDGRNRWNACKAAGVEPRFVDYQGNDPLALVISMNVRRRHLDESQRSLIASRLANMRQGERTDLQPSANLRKVSQAEAAERLNVSERSVTFAALVLNEATPALLHAVEQGKIAVSLAAKLAAAPEAIQRRAVAEPERAHVLVKQGRRAQRETELGARQLAWPTKVYGVIYADPPWPSGLLQPEHRHGSGSEAIRRWAWTQSRSSISRLLPRPIARCSCGRPCPRSCRLARPWPRGGSSTNPTSSGSRRIAGARRIAPARGTGIAACMRSCSSGHAARSLLQRRGRSRIASSPHPSASTRAKPEPFAEMIERLFPTLPKIELFARGKAKPGWDTWGNEVEPR